MEIKGLDEDAHYYDEFEVLGQGYWWGLKKGCVCSSGSGYAEVDNRECEDKMLSIGCYKIPDREFEWLPNVHSKKMCARRETGYNFISMELAKKKEDGTYVCESDNGFTKVCGTESGENKFVYCAPEKGLCPVTSIHFNKTL